MTPTIEDEAQRRIESGECFPRCGFYGDHYVETTVKGATLTEVRGAVEHLIDPKESMDEVTDKSGAIYIMLYQAGHDQYTSDAEGLKDELRDALDALIEQMDGIKEISYSRIHLWIYKYEWIQVW